RFFLVPRPSQFTLLPYTTLFRSCKSIWSTPVRVTSFSVGVCSSLTGLSSPSSSKSKRLGGDLDVEEAHVFGVFLDEVPAGLDVFAHQHGKDLVGCCGVVHGDLQQGALFWVHGGFPQFLVVHFAQTFVALDGVIFW